MIYKPVHIGDRWTVLNKQTGQTIDQFMPNERYAKSVAKSKEADLVNQMGLKEYRILNDKLNKNEIGANS